MDNCGRGREAAAFRCQAVADPRERIRDLRLSGKRLLDDRNRALLAARPERRPTVPLGEDRVVAADAGAVTGAEAGAALANEDHPGLHGLAVEDLHAEHLRVRVATVPRRPETFLVCHLVLLLRRERRLERRDRALARRVRTFELERRLEHRPAPAGRSL